MSDQYRTTASFRVASVSKRLVSGVMVPLGVDTRVEPDLVERFERPAFAHQYRAANRVWLRTAHRIAPDTHVIGAGVALRDMDDGLWGEFRVVASERGDEWLALAADDQIDLQWSIGFTPVRYHRDGPVTVYSRADVFELAFVPSGAYGQTAKVAAVREGKPGRLIDSLPPLPRLQPLT